MYNPVFPPRYFICICIFQWKPQLWTRFLKCFSSSFTCSLKTSVNLRITWDLVKSVESCYHQSVSWDSGILILSLIYFALVQLLCKLIPLEAKNAIHSMSCIHPAHLKFTEYFNFLEWVGHILNFIGFGLSRSTNYNLVSIELQSLSSGTLAVHKLGIAVFFWELTVPTWGRPQETGAQLFCCL